MYEITFKNPLNNYQNFQLLSLHLMLMDQLKGPIQAYVNNINFTTFVLAVLVWMDLSFSYPVFKYLIIESHCATLNTEDITYRLKFYLKH